MIIIVQGPPASGKTTLARAIARRFGLPHISRDILQEWMAAVEGAEEVSIRRFSAHAGYQLMFDLAGELAKGPGSFLIEGCMNPEGGPKHMKDKLGAHEHEIVEVFLTAPNALLVERYLGRAGTEARHSAHGNESTRGEELARHLEQVSYRPMRIGNRVIEIDTSEGFAAGTDRVLRELSVLLGR